MTDPGVQDALKSTWNINVSVGTRKLLFTLPQAQIDFLWILLLLNVQESGLGKNAEAELR